MSIKTSLTTITRLDDTIALRYPDATGEQIVDLRNKIVDNVADNLAQGFDIAYVKREGDQTILRILKLVEEDVD